MTHRELQLLAARERVTLRQRVRNSHRYWDICARYRGELSTLYLCTDSALATLSEDDFLQRVRSLPGHRLRHRRQRQVENNAILLNVRSGRPCFVRAQ
jgi:hypothetical protein